MKSDVHAYHGTGCKGGRPTYLDFFHISPSMLPIVAAFQLTPRCGRRCTAERPGTHVPRRSSGSRASVCSARAPSGGRPPAAVVGAQPFVAWPPCAPHRETPFSTFFSLLVTMEDDALQRLQPSRGPGNPRPRVDRSRQATRLGYRRGGEPIRVTSTSIGKGAGTLSCCYCHHHGAVARRQDRRAQPLES